MSTKRELRRLKRVTNRLSKQVRNIQKVLLNGDMATLHSFYDHYLLMPKDKDSVGYEFEPKEKEGDNEA